MGHSLPMTPHSRAPPALVVAVLAGAIRETRSQFEHRVHCGPLGGWPCSLDEAGQMVPGDFVSILMGFLLETAL